ncbi:hypothetical protein [Sphingomonas crocodyli]|uniref:C-type lysozyme inhibitor domain-containing protein n=1 Tax=Sphingomonas crocodyli TaxID=1979270 RepID=A0A437M5U5_9SPHN|nr:hypothetical protein [Sphingomonas crocodyli]RVT93101.1 hypothetical protein EOD43_04175 [Sphingomonas crocodyli]
MTVALKALALFAAMTPALGGCSKPKDPPPPSEAQVHSIDSGMESGEIGWHPYRCSDGKPLLVEFKDNGLQISLRGPKMANSITLSAPAQGLQYVGDASTATLAGAKLILAGAGVGDRTCMRASVN